MPTYEYVCEACGHRWEAFQSIKADALKDCPECAEARAKRVVSGGMGFILKGGGWYSDLYASPKKDQKGDAKEGGEGAKAGGEGAKSGGEGAKSGGEGAKESKGTESKGASSKSTSDSSSKSD